MLRGLLKTTGGGYAAVIDFVGIPKTVEFGLALLRKGGKRMVVGQFGDAVEVAIPMLPLQSIRLEGLSVGRLDELQQLAALGRDGKNPGIPVADDALSGVQQAPADLRAGKVAERTVLCAAPSTA